MEQYNVILNKFPANPRSKRRLASQGFFGSESSSGGSNIGGSSFSGYWDLITTNAAGDVLEEGEGYIRTKYSAVSEKDVIAYATGNHDIILPIASADALGTIKIGNGLKINEDGTLSVDGEIGGGGVSSWNDLTDKPSIFPSSWEQVAGKPTEFIPSAHTHVMNDITDFNGVTIDTDQTITGQKTFSKAILGQADVVAFATGKHDITFPIASKTALGCIKVGENLTITEDGTLNAQAGGGITSVTWNDILNKPIFSTVATSGSYTDLLNKPTIPTNNNQLTNGSGYITGVNLDMWNAAASSVGNKTIGNSNNGNYIDIIEDLRVKQNCTFSKTPKVGNTNIALTSDLHSHSNKNYLDAINQNLSTSSTPLFAGGIITGDNTDVHIEHSGGNSINGKDQNNNVANLYLNYNSASNNTKIDKDNNISTSGDIVAYSTGVGTQSPFKYWKPSVSSSGVLSWTNSISEIVPSSVNIKGPKGDKGDKGDIGPQGPKGDRGLTGPQGPTGPSWGGGTITNGIKIKSDPPVLFWGDNWRIQSGIDLNFYHSNWAGACMYISGTNYGNVEIRGTLTQKSDIRLKTIHSELFDCLDKISVLDVFQYTYNDSDIDRWRIGMSAQQVINVFPELIYTESDGFYSMDYISLSCIAIQCNKELHQLIKSQQIRINELESRLTNLETKIFKDEKNN